MIENNQDYVYIYTQKNSNYLTPTVQENTKVSFEKFFQDLPLTVVRGLQSRKQESCVFVAADKTSRQCVGC